MLIDANGSVTAAMNSDAPELALPDWSDALEQHAKDYLAALGIDPCQVQLANIESGASGSSGGPTTFSRTVSVMRGVDSIPVGQSVASVQFKSTDVTTLESFYWPTIPADVVARARAFRDRLKDPTQLAAYRAMLPADAQGDGQVLIAHTGRFSSTGGFQAFAAWYVLVGGSSGATVPFDENGARLPQL